jgi:small subunit ribosomal protein S8
MHHNLSDLIIRIKNAQKLHLISIKVIKTNLAINFLFLLYKMGLIRSFFVLRNQREILVYLKYRNKKPLIFDITVVSKPSKRIYWSLSTLSIFYRKYSLSTMYILSTSKGLITSNDAILKDFVSGEVLCKIKF